MNSKLRRCFWILLWMLSALSARGAQQRDSANFSAREMAEAADVESRTVGGEIAEVRSVLPLYVGAPRGFAFVILLKHEWRIAFVKAENGRLRLGWLSDVMPPQFEGTALNASLDIVVFDSEQAVEFRACANHMCPYVFGIALFRLGDGKEFMLKVNRLKSNQVEYSPDLLVPKNQKYKDWLDEQIKGGPIMDPRVRPEGQ